MPNRKRKIKTEKTG